MSGLDYMREMLAGRVPHPAIAGLFGYRLREVDDGQVTFEALARLPHTNPMGAVHGGWYGTLLDSALGCAVMTKVPQGRWYTTLEYKVNLLRALPLETPVLVTGFSEHAGRTTATARAEMRGAGDNRLYATGSTTCILLD
nr:PaaI family thioesterase [Szabonella alba]